MLTFSWVIPIVRIRKKTNCVERYKFNAGLYNFVFESKVCCFMKCKIKAFGISREIVGGRVVELDIPTGATVADLKAELHRQFPSFGALKSLYVAVNQQYAEEQGVLQEGDEIALIPPVSGG
jgi:sulfur-carrier protein